MVPVVRFDYNFSNTQTDGKRRKSLLSNRSRTRLALIVVLHDTVWTGYCVYLTLKKIRVRATDFFEFFSHWYFNIAHANRWARVWKYVPPSRPIRILFVSFSTKRIIQRVSIFSSGRVRPILYAFRPTFPLTVDRSHCRAQTARYRFEDGSAAFEHGPHVRGRGQRLTITNVITFFVLTKLPSGKIRFSAQSTRCDCAPCWRPVFRFTARTVSRTRQNNFLSWQIPSSAAIHRSFWYDSPDNADDDERLRDNLVELLSQFDTVGFSTYFIPFPSVVMHLFILSKRTCFLFLSSPPKTIYDMYAPWRRLSNTCHTCAYLELYFGMGRGAV